MSTSTSAQASTSKENGNHPNESQPTSTAKVKRESYASRRNQNLTSLRQSLLDNPPSIQSNSQSLDFKKDSQYIKPSENSKKSKQTKDANQNDNHNHGSNLNHNHNLPSHVNQHFQVSSLPKKNFLSIEYPSFLFDQTQSSTSHANTTQTAAHHRPPPTTSPSLNLALKSLDPSNSSSHSALDHLSNVVSKSMLNLETKRNDLIKHPVTLRFTYPTSVKSNKIRDEMQGVVEENGGKLTSKGKGKGKELNSDRGRSGKKTKDQQVDDDVEMTDGNDNQESNQEEEDDDDDSKKKTELELEKEEEEERIMLENFRHSIIGSLQDGGNLVGLIKKKKWRRKKKNNDNDHTKSKSNGNQEGEEEIIKEYSFQIIGTSNKVVRFRSMADFNFKPEIGKVQLQDLVSQETKEKDSKIKEKEVASLEQDQEGDVEMNDENEDQISIQNQNQNRLTSSKEPQTSNSIKYSPKNHQKDIKGFPKAKNTLGLVKSLIEMNYKDLLDYSLVEDWNTGLGLSGDEDQDQENGDQDQDVDMETEGSNGKKISSDQNDLGSKSSVQIGSKKGKGDDLKKSKDYKSIHMIPPPLFSHNLTPWMYE